MQHALALRLTCHLRPSMHVCLVRLAWGNLQICQATIWRWGLQCPSECPLLSTCLACHTSARAVQRKQTTKKTWLLGWLGNCVCPLAPGRALLHCLANVKLGTLLHVHLLSPCIYYHWDSWLIIGTSACFIGSHAIQHDTIFALCCTPDSLCTLHASMVAPCIQTDMRACWRCLIGLRMAGTCGGTI